MMNWKLRAEDIVFWILILAIIAIVIWLAFGSPPIENSLLMLVIFIASSEILLWKAFFAIDKKTSVGFERVKNKLDNLEISLNNKLNNIEISFNNKVTNVEKSLNNGLDNVRISLNKINKKIRIK